jgi:hypothetical protein
LLPQTLSNENEFIGGTIITLSTVSGLLIVAYPDRAMLSVDNLKLVLIRYLLAQTAVAAIAS